MEHFFDLNGFEAELLEEEYGEEKRKDEGMGWGMQGRQLEKDPKRETPAFPNVSDDCNECIQQILAWSAPFPPLS